jgi:hypothetical protein
LRHDYKSLKVQMSYYQYIDSTGRFLSLGLISRAERHLAETRRGVESEYGTTNRDDHYSRAEKVVANSDSEVGSQNTGGREDDSR